MSTPIKDGGPAFPWGEDGVRLGGMSLRDYFAAKAMASIFGGIGARQVASTDGRYDGTNWSQVVAANAYEMADTMLATREAQP